MTTTAKAGLGPMADLFPSKHLGWEERKSIDVWPNGARVAVLVYTAPEEWLWDRNEAFSPPGTGATGVVSTSPPLSTRSAIEYGFSIGLMRLREIYAKHDMKVTLWSSARAIELHREVFELLVEDGHEIGAHGNSQGQPLGTLSLEEQQASIEHTIEVVKDLTGAPPRGWIGPGGDATAETINLLARNGFVYGADLQDDELPYVMEVEGRRLLQIPYRKVGNINDLPIFTRNVNSVSSGLQYLKDAFDAYVRAAQSTPLLFNYGTHPHISGRPDNAYVLDQFLDYVHQFDDVWVTNYSEICDWWLQQHA